MLLAGWGLATLRDMTLPVNRYSALLEARALLLSLSGEHELPERVRQHALSVLKHYPTEAELRRLAELAPEVLSARLVS